MAIQGSPGNDYLAGTQVDDQIYGNGGNDTLIGATGNDYLVGGVGNDILTGGSGKDTFVLYYSGGGIDTITDFSFQTDVLKITSAPIPPSYNIVPPKESVDTVSPSGAKALDTTTDCSVKDKNVLKITTAPTEIMTNATSKKKSLPVIKQDGIYDYEGKNIDTIIDFSADNKDVIKNNTLSLGIIQNSSSSLNSAKTNGLNSSASTLPSYLTYNPATGALFYLQQQLAWLPPNLD
ncbi:hypothetical protein [uncultured Nostoc sp.]|uniref:hypothetical protein n=1 Tax=uncultured Nostoc sp. TaxID=340711 RepID=UPI0035CC0DBB